MFAGIMAALRNTYTDTVFGLVKGAFLAGCAIGIIFTIIAAADLLFGFHWRFSWTAIPGGLLFSVCCFGGYLFVGLIARVFN
jgi:hypothetical protein